MSKDFEGPSIYSTVTFPLTNLKHSLVVACAIMGGEFKLNGQHLIFTPSSLLKLLQEKSTLPSQNRQHS